MNRDILYRFFKGHASIAEMKLVKEWIENSDENRKSFYSERRLFDVETLVNSSELNALLGKKGRRRRLFVRECLKIVSVIVITVCVTVAFLSIKENNGNMDMVMQTITVPAGQRLNLGLPDGTDVWLNAGTQIQYPVTFTKGKREVILDGEAYFEVAHNEKRPFVVHTSMMDVEVLGTKFNVEAYSKRKVFETSLMEGRVNVKSLTNGNVSILFPHYKATLKDGRFIINQINDYNVYRWKEGLYCFKNKPFIEIVSDLERYYDLKIQMDKFSIAGIKLTGKFRIADGLDYALRVLQNDVPFNYQRNKENDIIYIN